MLYVLAQLGQYYVPHIVFWLSLVTFFESNSGIYLRIYEHSLGSPLWMIIRINKISYPGTGSSFLFPSFLGETVPVILFHFHPNRSNLINILGTNPSRCG